MDDKPKRRRFRFSLRTLLVLVTIACAGFGWLGVKVRQVKRQRDAVAAIERLGLVVHYNYHYDSNGSFRSQATPPGPEWLRERIGDDFFANVAFVGFSILLASDTDSMTNQSSLFGGQRLDLTQITDADLIHFQGLPQLRYLNLKGTKVTDAGLLHLQGLHELRFLYLDRTQVTDTGLVYLHRLRKLEIIGLRGTPVTTRGLEQLRNVTPQATIYSDL